MNKNGFFLKKLRVSGTKATSVELEFKKGFNLISGPSDTGKTYAFQCINYMLGASTPPKQIKESKPYSKAFLEIESYTGRVLTFERNFSGGPVLAYETCMDSLRGHSPIQLKEQHESGNPETLSSLLLSLSGLLETKSVRTNALNETREFSFRDFRRLTLIDETRIITDKSPILFGQYTEATSEKSVFEIILTGIDASDLIKYEKSEIRKARIGAKIELLEKQLAKAIFVFEKESSGNEIVDIQRQIDKINSILESISNNIVQITDSVNRKLEIKKDRLASLTTKKSRGIVLEELLSRFSLLRNQYDSDLQRLEFLKEGGHYFSILKIENCLSCGRPIDNDNASLKDIDELEIFQSGINAESIKIKTHIKDLLSTVEAMLEEKRELEKEIQSAQIDMERIDQEIKSELQPKLIITKAAFKSWNDKKEELIRLQYLHSTINELQIEKNIYENQLKEKVKKPKKVVKITPHDLYDLSKHIQLILKNWNYPNLSSVEFSQDINDILISGEPRGNHGKGYRAILYTSFIIGIMRYCIEKEFPHPGIVVLDSPLTTYRRSDPTTEDVTKDMQESFFKDLSNLPIGEQIIVFENKEPETPSQSSNINHIHFTKLVGSGRYGFFEPVLK